MYQIIVNHPLYADVPPMPAYNAKDLREIMDELTANGVRKSQIKVSKSTDNDPSQE